MHPEEDRSMNSVVVNSPSFHSIKSVITTRVETSSKYKRDMGRNNKLMPIGIFKKYSLMLQMSS